MTGFNEVAHEQGSPAWLSWRASKWTASDAGAILGCAPEWAMAHKSF